MDSLVVLLAVVARLVSAVDDSAITIERDACLYHSQLTLSCPTDHIVVIRTAQYFKGFNKGCNPDDTTVCEMEIITKDYLDLCLSLDSCVINLKQPQTVNPCTGYKGDPFLKVTYSCEPYMKVYYQQNVKYLCNFLSPEVWSGSLLYLWNPSFPFFTDRTDCGCVVRVPTGVEFELFVPHFEPAAEEKAIVTAEGCSQVMTIQSGYQRETLCSVNQDSFKKLDIAVNGELYLQFTNPNKHKIRFWIVMKVHHEYNFTVTCPKDFKMPELPHLTETQTSGSTSTVTPSVQNYQSHNEPQSATLSQWPIITGIVAAVCIVLVMVVAILLFCRRNERQKILRQKGANELHKFTYQNSLYMTHGQVNNRPPSSICSGSNHSSQLQQTAVNVEIYTTKNSASLGVQNNVHQIAVHVTELADDNIPPEVRDKLAFQDETTLKPLEMGASRSTNKGKEVDQDDVTPYSSMTDLSVKDLARLMENQIQGNKL